MKLRKRERMAIGLAVLALGALLVDRLMTEPERPAGPAAARAEPALPDAGSAARTAEAAPGAAKSEEDHEAALQGYDAVVPARDPFALTPQLLAGFRLASAEREEEQAAQLEEETRTIEEFLDGHRLDAVLLSARRPLAIINGRELHLGQSISGYTLVAVEPLSATLESNGRRVQLFVPLVER